jgi:hypothetical protein
MPVSLSVSVERGNPLPVWAALLFTFVGGTLIVLGFTVIPPIPDADAGVFMDVLALLFIVPAWLFYIAFHIKNFRRRRREVIHVPDELAEPPADLDAAVVATIVGEGTPSRVAVAGTLLQLAADGQLGVQEYGERVVIDIPAGRTGTSGTDGIVVDGLREVAGPDGDVTGSPVWPEKVRWWRAYRTAARKQATTAGMIVPRIPYIGLMLVAIFTSVGFSLIIFERVTAFVGLVLLANGLPHLITRLSGVKLGPTGRRSRAEWLAFGRYLRAHSNLREVGPGAVAIWGPNLFYGVVLGEAPHAAAPLTPGAADDREDLAPSGPIAVEI